MRPVGSEQQGGRGAGEQGRIPSARRRLIVIVLIAALAGLALWWLAQGNGLGRPDRSWERVRERGVLWVGMDMSYPPFDFVDDQSGASQPAGLDADLARAIAERLGLRAEFVNLSYDALYDALAAEQVDVLISALIIDPTRMSDFAYTEPYFNAGQVLVVRRDGPLPQSMDDLAGLRLAVELGSDGDVEGRRWARRLPDLDVRAWPEPGAAIGAVERGEADAALVDGISARMALRDRPVLRLSGDPVTYEPYAIVALQRSQALLEVVERTLEALREDGTLGKLLARWL